MRYGDFKDYVDDRYAGVTYIGIDQQPECIAEARARHGNRPGTCFCQTDFTTVAFAEVDVVLASGALSYRCADPQFYAGMIEKMYWAATRAVAFDVLDRNVFPPHPLLVGHDPEQVIAWCKAVTPNVKVLKGYPPDDVTLFMYKEEADCGEAAEPL